MAFSITVSNKTKALLKKMEKLKKIFKNAFNPKDIYSSHRPMIHTYILDGLFPFKLNKDKTQLVSSKMGISLTIIHLIFYFTCFLLTICDNQSFVVYFFQTEISVFGGYLQFATSCVAVVLLFSIAIIRRHKIRLVLKSLHAVDKRFKDLYEEIDHKAVFYLILIAMIVLYLLNLTFVLLSLLLLGTKNKYPDFVVWWSFFFPYLILTLVVVKFVTVMSQIVQRFRALTKVRYKKIIFIYFTYLAALLYRHEKFALVSGPNIWGLIP